MTRIFISRSRKQKPKGFSVLEFTIVLLNFPFFKVFFPNGSVKDNGTQKFTLVNVMKKRRRTYKTVNVQADAEI